MTLKTSTCSPASTIDESQLSQITSVIERHKDKPGALIQVLHQAQQICGYLPAQVQEMIADGMDISLPEVSGVVSFYSFFFTEPRGDHAVRVCMGTACYVRGGQAIVEHLENSLDVEVGGTTEDRLFTLEVARCIGACGLAPAMMIDETVYKQVSENGLENTLAHYRKEAGK
ncbi:MAG: NAD(P)H-dependent oxidoreductase subunit E [Micrococcales bacterium]|nr:NAD(P)H-dependent oxidoreductase subunit E [Micrococcales bacterium]